MDNEFRRIGIVFSINCADFIPRMSFRSIGFHNSHFLFISSFLKKILGWMIFVFILASIFAIAH